MKEEKQFSDFVKEWWIWNKATAVVCGRKGANPMSSLNSKSFWASLFLPRRLASMAIYIASKSLFIYPSFYAMQVMSQEWLEIARWCDELRLHIQHTFDHRLDALHKSIFAERACCKYSRAHQYYYILLVWLFYLLYSISVPFVTHGGWDRSVGTYWIVPLSTDNYLWKKSFYLYVARTFAAQTSWTWCCGIDPSCCLPLDIYTEWFTGLRSNYINDPLVGGNGVHCQ